MLLFHDWAFLSVAVELQSGNLRFDSAKWSTRQSGGANQAVFQSPFGAHCLVEERPITNLIVSVIVGDIIVSKSPWSILVLVILPPSLSQFQFLRHHLLPTNLKKLWQPSH